MRLQNNIYANWKAIVNDLAAPDAILYTSDGTNVTAAWAIWKTVPLCVMAGDQGSSIGVTSAAFLVDYAAATLITSSVSVSESY